MGLTLREECIVLQPELSKMQAVLQNYMSPFEDIYLQFSNGGTVEEHPFFLTLLQRSNSLLEVIDEGQCQEAVLGSNF